MKTVDAEFNAAISTHQYWLVRFENAFKDINREIFDAKTLSDDTICDFGRWLRANPDLFPNPELLERVKTQHKHFHEKAGLLALRIRSYDHHGNIRQQMDELHQLSDGLVRVLHEVRDFPK